MALSYFTTKTWKFENANFVGLIDKIPDEDREEFDYNFENIDYIEFLKNAALGCQKFMFKETNPNRTAARRQYQR